MPPSRRFWNEGATKSATLQQLRQSVENAALISRRYRPRLLTSGKAGHVNGS